MDFQKAADYWNNYDIDEIDQEWEQFESLVQQVAEMVYGNEIDGVNSFPNARNWHNQIGQRIIARASDPEAFKQALNMVILTEHWKSRFSAIKQEAKKHGIKFNEIEDAEICERLRDPVFNTGCNDYPDWRSEEDIESMKTARRVYRENKAFEAAFEAAMEASESEE